MYNRIMLKNEKNKYKTNKIRFNSNRFISKILSISLYIAANVMRTHWYIS